MLCDCHSHMVLDGENWREAIARHRAAPDEAFVRKTLETYARLGFSYLRVNEIYSYNSGSQRLFTRCGFLPERETPQGKSYRLDLTVET